MSLQDLARAAGISADDEELLALLLAEEGVELAPSEDAIPRQPGRAEAPLSFSQERLWFLDRLAPGTATYNIPAAVRLQGALWLDVFARSWREILARHDSLRTRFESRGGAPVQVIDRQPTPGSELNLVDLAGLPAEARGRTASALARAEVARPFDLARGPVARATLVQLASDEHLLLLTLHHIVSDGWSMGVLVREVAALYDAFLNGRPSPLPPLRIQYPDFAEWQRARLTGERLEAELAYWRERLAGAPVLALPTDRPRPAVASARGATIPFRLPEAVTAALRRLTEEQGATIFMTLLAALDALFERHTGQRDMVVGSMIANRTRAEVEELIGFFINALAIRADLAGDPPFRALLDRVREAALGAFAHQDLPFEKLVAEVQPERDLSRSPLFQVVFLVQNTPQAALQLAGLTLSPVELEVKSAKFDLQVTVVEHPRELGGSFNYSTDLFDATTMERLCRHFQTLVAGVAGIAGSPDARLSELPLLSPAERQAILEWNGTAADYPTEACLHELIAAQVARTPDAPALAFEDATLSYGELAARAGRLARHLCRLGVGPEVAVGVCVERSLELVVGLLAVLQAGGAYLPLDAAYPRERLARMLEDGRPPVVLAQAKTAALLPTHEGRTVLVDAPLELDEERSLPAIRAVPENLAYVIFTSGSTGRPKGAMNRHRSIVNRLLWMQEEYRIGPGDRVLQKTPASFDVSVWEFFWPLMTGACLVVARPGGHQDPAYLARTMAEREITTLHFVPAMLQVFLGEPEVERATALRQVMASGEALPAALAERFFARFPRVGLHNLYGPTEAAVDVTYWPCAPGATVVPIGRPVANTAIRLLDAELRPVPVGVAGELLIGGVQLARGYLGRPDLTAERFVPDPTAGAVGERLYRTGDLARHLPGGEVEYLGRIDHQVKIRGLRIELGEIEAALLSHPAVAEAVVLVREERGDRRLVAYLVGKEGGAPQAPHAPHSPDTAELRAFLAAQLPEHMVPAAFVLLDALPLTPNGKVDRGALGRIAPELPGGAAGEADAAPRGPLEEILAEIWSDLLAVERPGRDASFFELGGHSLLATQLVSRLRQALDLELPLRRIFEAPTIARLAALIQGLAGEQAGAAGSAAPPPLVRVERTGDLPLSFAQERLWFLDQLAPGSPAYNIPAAFTLSGRLSVPALARSFGEIVRRHETLRTTFPLAGLEGRPAQVIALASGSTPAFPLPEVDLAGLPAARGEAELRRLVQADAQRPFDLARGPLLRGTLVRYGSQGEREHALLFAMHHIASDGWSMGVLVRELGALYRAFVSGRPSPLPELPVQYADFAAWQRRWLAGPVLAGELAWWRQALAGLQPLDLPTDRPRPPVVTTRGGVRPFALSAELSAALVQGARSAGATLFMALLAAFAALLARSTGRDDLAVGSPIANRTRREIEGLIGFFVNTLVLRIDIGGGAGRPTFRELLSRVRAVALAAFAHQDLPFEKVVEELQPERDTSRTPLFEVMLVLQNAPAGPLELPDLRLAPLPNPSRTAKFDLNVALAQTAAGLAGAWEHNSDLFDPTTAERMAHHFAILLEGLAADPERPFTELSLLSAGESHQLLTEWNDPSPTAATDLCLHELFARAVERAPEATAVTLESAQLSYGELDRAANRLARHLRRLGVVPGEPVALCLERSLEMVVAILAVLKAGGVYLPLDPQYPAERLAFTLRDSGARVLLTEERFRDLPPFQDVRAVLLDDRRGDRAAWRGEGAEGLEPAASATAAAYVIYTSGSTGTPKGVVVRHANVASLLASTQAACAHGPADVWTLFHSYAFDFSVWELWGALAHGGRLVVVPYWVSRSPEAFHALLEQEGVTVLNQTPSAFRQLIWAEPAASPEAGAAALRLVIFGGEALDLGSLAPWFARHGDRRPTLVNMYGITETTVHVTWRPLAAGEPAGASPIGLPIPGWRALLLDRHGVPVPLGVPGEIQVGGEGLAMGYLGRPELTAERFVPDPWSALPGGRLYRSGDLARRRREGGLEYLGRIDQQVKIRGFRIELGEIEAALSAHPAVREAVVLVREDPGDPRDRRLVGYLAVDPAALDGSTAAGTFLTELRAFLAAKLPAHMVPAGLVVLDALPLTANGKVDRRALARLAPERAAGAAGPAGADAADRAPRGPVEEILAEIWSDLLRLERVGRDVSFFELGGHSLLATQLVSRIRRAFGVELPLRRVFETPTVAALGVAVEAVQAEIGGVAPPIGRAPRDLPLPLSFAQERLWFIDQFEPGRAVYNIPMALSCQGTLDVRALAAALAGVVDRHESLRTTFAVTAGHAVQVIAPEVAVPLPVIDLSALPEALRAPLAERSITAAAWRPFDLATGPLLRALVLCLGPNEHALLLTLHHIVADGWSMEVLVGEIAALYRVALAGEPSPLPPLPIQYADFAVWQRRWLAGEVLEAQLAYWRERLAGPPPVLDLPLDRPRPPVHTWNGARAGRPLPAALAAGLAGLARRGQATLFMVLLAAWDALLARWTGQRDFAVGTPIAGRRHPETEGLIGFFVNTLALRVQIAGRPSFLDLLGRVREAALGGYAHQDVPFEKLVEEVAVERSLEHTPLFQVMFILQQSAGIGAGGSLALPGLTLSPIAYENRTAKFDLTLMFEPRPEALRAMLGYNTDLFRRDTILRLLGHLEGLLAGAVAEPERPLAELPLLTPAERHQLLVDWNDTALPADIGGVPEVALGDPCLHDLFLGWAARQPRAVAAVLGDEAVTYGDLARRSGRLAARLRCMGVGPEIRVGLCLPRSFDLLVALLAVLEAGGAYVPLDPANPRDRLLFLLADSRVPVLLTHSSLATLLGEPLADSALRLICLDFEEGEEEKAEAEEREETGELFRDPRVGPDDLAYVIYTSGSTGTPNGVLVPHRGAVNLICAAAALYQVTPESRVLQTASVGFDASVLEIFLALGHGASLCLVREEERLTPAVLADRLIGQRVTTGVVTPSLLSVLPEARLGGLRSISVGGEACPAELAARWAPTRRFLNCYGPTETTIFATVAILTGSEPVTIGRPVANAGAWIVDRELLPLPIGAVGELVIGGVGLARGYLDRPEKTATKFVPDPFSERSDRGGARLYRTGDLARFTPAGEIEFLGRLDDQVKVRGFRIELGEIEAALLRCPGVQAAVVLAPADAQGERRLVAYVAGPAAERPSVADLRTFLEVHLPEYMVPAHLVLLDALPTTPGGKVDRRALPDPFAEPAEAQEHVAPKTAAERFVAALWREVLGVSRVSATDDFFALGGNSIKGAILTNRLQEELGEYVYVVALFDAPTLQSLARYLEENYAEALARVTGERAAAAGSAAGRVDAFMIGTLRAIIPPLEPAAPGLRPSAKNRRAVFLLSPPRSGSTLLRVMLAGNPALFAPPELELLGFNTLPERKAAFSGRWALWQEGTIRALMEVYGCDAEEAKQRMEEAEEQELSVQQFYAQLQAAIGDRLLVDKTPSYALDPATLARAEEDFAEPLYVHLLRHPYGMIRSFEKAKLEQVFFRPSHPFTRRQLAELIWDVSQENILELLARVPAERQVQLRFEEMLKDPEREMRRVCRFLGVPFHPGMLDPYADTSRRMTDGIHQLSKMVGDVKFHEHKGIEAQTADSWRREVEEDFLGEVTWELAAQLGYIERAERAERAEGQKLAKKTAARPRFSPLVPLVPQKPIARRKGRGARPLFLVHPVGGNVLCYAELARRLGEGQPVYGLQSLGLGGGAPEERVEEMAATYVAALREAQPRGPYRLGGWSIGGAIAYETAQELRRGGHEVELLALLDSLAPARAREEEPAEIDEALLLAGLAHDLGGLAGRPLVIAPEELAGLSPEAGLSRVVEKARAAGALEALGPGVGEEQIGRLFRVFRANVRAVRAYRPEPYPGRAVLFVTHDNPERGRLGDTLGWERLVQGGLASGELPGGHYALLREPVVAELAARLRERLAGSPS
jgi:amino acid adenylation domain-containing protein